ncbi:HAD-IA family hydrolase [Microbacterium sp. LWO14-1.2]|uniref:HAD family hydrolase n=1 Tax=Microbacterium sp. LWO14-1.2 TaxID=3135263 RepID=UPI003138B015
MPEKPWILFDVGGVLEVVDDDTWQEQWWERVRAVSGLAQDELDARIDAADLPRIDLTVGTEGAFWAGLAAGLELDDAQRAAIRADFWDAYCGTGNHELIEYARSLRGRARTAILSNSADGAREEEERRFGFAAIFDPICYSHELGVAKPEPDAYLCTLEALGAEPEDVLFIDDHELAIDGAAAVGIRGVLHRNNTSTIAAIERFLVDG